jgi:hypothetical protein
MQPGEDKDHRSARLVQLGDEAGMTLDRRREGHGSDAGTVCIPPRRQWRGGYDCV